MTKSELDQYKVDTYPLTIPPTTDEHVKRVWDHLRSSDKINSGEITTTAEVDKEFE